MVKARLLVLAKMFDGEEVRVKLECRNDLMKYVIDRFGMKFKTEPATDETTYCYVEVCLCPTFYGWVFGFKGDIKIIEPGNIRRMLAAGRLEGKKIGNQWVIPYNAEYPNDKRTKSGKYRNWRKRISLNSDRELMAIIKQLIQELITVYGGILHEVILYGSYARGEQTEESDVDIALILKADPSREMTDKMIV